MSLILLLLGFVQNASATEFHCYNFPGHPANVFQYASGTCGGADPQKQQMIQNGKKDVMCMYNAGCMPVPEGKEGTPAPELTHDQLNTMFQQGVLKTSNLFCQGEAQIVNGVMTGMACPSADKCRKDVFYNPIAVNLSAVEKDKEYKYNAPENPYIPPAAK